MFDVQLAQESVLKIKEADYSPRVLTYDERQNLIAMMEDWWQDQGWDLEELRRGQDNEDL